LMAFSAIAWTLFIVLYSSQTGLVDWEPGRLVDWETGTLVGWIPVYQCTNIPGLIIPAFSEKW
jgi:hypothetical protein